VNRLTAEAQAALEALERAGLRRRIEPARGIDFSSNDTLGLRTDPRVLEAAAAALREFGTGAGAARLLRGDCAPHRELEAALRHHAGAEDALLFGSGYLANLGVIETLAGEGWTILSDADNHASLIAGCRAAKAHVQIIPHNDVAAFASALTNDRTMFVTEAVFSMSGDRAPVGALGELCHGRGATLVVDEAHSVGIFPCEGDATIRIIPCGKALGGAGAVVTGPAPIIELLRSRCRTFLFTTAPPPALAASVLAAFRIAQAEPWRAERALALARRVDPGAQSPIVLVPCRNNEDALERQRTLQSQGLDVRAVRPPTVRRAALRLSLHADRTDEEVDRLLEALA
jgi:8-amino-7-oxononanoate synthase